MTTADLPQKALRWWSECGGRRRPGRGARGGLRALVVDVEVPIPVRLKMKRTVLKWLRWQGSVTEREIRDLEHQDAEEQRRREVAHRELRWTLSEARAVEGHPVLHRGNCSLAAQYGGAQLLDRDGVVAAAEMHPDLEMCGVCAPWGSLGIDKPAGPPARPGAVEFP